MQNDIINATTELFTESGKVLLGESKEACWEDEFSEYREHTKFLSISKVLKTIQTK